VGVELRSEASLDNGGHIVRRRSALAVISVCAIGALGFAGCGDDEEDEAQTPAQPATPAKTTGGGGGGATRVELAADKSRIAYDKKSLSAKAGEVEISFTNPSAIPHDVAVEGNGVDEKTEVIQDGKSAELAVDLEPGTYTFYCTVDGHKQQGMQGTLTVK
jgi:plastocyanin